MRSLWSHLATIVRRTTQPYEIQLRTIIAFDFFLITLFLLLGLLRYVLIQDCPDVLVRGTIPGSLVRVAAACPTAGWGWEFGVSVIDNLTAALIVALLTSWLIWLMSPKAQVEEDIAALAPWNIRPALLAPLPETRRYHYRGRSGRFLRSKVIPELFKAGKISATRRQLFLLLPNPSEISMLDQYAHYRNSLSSDDGKWNTDRIQVEIIATILVTAYHNNTNQFFEASVYLKSDFSLFRLDMSDQRLILTREDESWPGIICSSQSKFYASYEEEFHIEAGNGIELPLEKADLPDRFDETNVNPALVDLGINIVLSNELAKQVIKAVRNPKLPYV